MISTCLRPCQPSIRIRSSQPRIAKPFLKDPNIRLEMHNYLGGISRTLGCPPLIVGGVEDHIHILATMSRTVSQADWIKELKRASNIWIKPRCPEFRWQGGYGIFSVGASQIPTVRDYIANQEEHHRKGSFQDEYLALLKAHGIEWDDRYVWD